MKLESYAMRRRTVDLNPEYVYMLHKLQSSFLEYNTTQEFNVD